MVAALSLDGYEAVHVVQGSVDGEEFLDFIVNTVVCCTFYLFRSLLHPLPAAKMNRYPQDKSILVLDNCAIDKTHVLQEIVEGLGHVLLFLPPYSPDFNPIEESFGCGMSHKLHK